MATKRQDVWKADEDELLVDTILRFIRDKKTQTEALEVVSKKLGRTTAACGFRWNSVLRKKYKEEIEQAKMESGKTPEKTKKDKDTAITYEKVRQFLDQMYYKLQSLDEKKWTSYCKKIKDLKSELEKTKIQNEQLIKELEKMREENDYLNGIVGKVRNVVVTDK